MPFDSPFDGMWSNSLFGGDDGLSPYAVLSQYEPPIVGNYSSILGNHGTGYFRKGGVEVAHDDLLLHVATTNATLKDSNGALKWRAHNLFLNSATPATQSVTVVSGIQYTVEMTGTGSLALSGAGSGTVSEGSPVTFTAGTTSLTATLTGSGALMWMYRSDLGGMQDNPDNTATGLESYVPTTSAAVYKRRNNYAYDGSNWIGPKMLNEPEAFTNLVPYSNDFNNAAWTRVSVTATAGAAVGSDGEMSMSKIAATATALSKHQIYDIGITITSGSFYSISCDMKADELNFGILNLYDTGDADTRVWFDLANGLVATEEAGIVGAIVDLGGGIYRCSAYKIAGSTSGGASAEFSNADNVSSFTAGSIGDGIFMGFVQYGLGSVASSYIPTAGSTINRALEALDIIDTNLVSVVNTTAMSISMKGTKSYADLGVAGQTVLHRLYVDANNSIIVDMDTDGAATGEINFNQNTAGTLVTVPSSATAYAAGVDVPFNIASWHTSAAVNGAVDGVALTEAATSLADLSTANFQIAHTGIHNIEEFRIFGVKIGDDGIAEVSA